MLQDRYDAKTTETKWRAYWEQSGAHHLTDLAKAKKPYYCTPMLPYPSGDKLHVGHWYNYGPTDSWARYMRMKGFDVFEPMGFDAFGLPAENYAIKTGVHPAESITKNVAKMTEQLKRMGCMYDWERSLNTSTPEYYKWTQWLFLQMFEHNLAYQKEGMVNWCPSCKTVLANEQVVDGKCERCESEVEQKKMKQWYWRTTQYAQRLLDNLDTLDWPEKTKAMQRNWIGRSEGIDIDFPLENGKGVLTAYTTRPDTLYSVTFVCIAPEHPLVEELTKGTKYEKDVSKAVQQILRQTAIERSSEGGKDKIGAFLGVNVINPATQEKIPVYVANFALMYGTGVVMADAHDQRDFEFARKYQIPLKFVVSPDGKPTDPNDADSAYVDDGILFDSGEFSGMSNREALPKIADWLEKKKCGKRKINYRLRDWSVSRQRYWGAPIPIVYDPDGKPHAIPEKHLPWLLPTDVDFKPTGVPPLAKSKELFARTEKLFGKGWTPEVETMDTFVCSSFYTLRYLDPTNEKQFVDKKLAAKWVPIAMYTGGPEHATGHLIYARFVHMALHDWGFLGNEEPFQRLVHQGLITHQGAKMSKSKGNVVSPDEFVEKYGSDVFRMYLMFLGPFTQGGDWSDRGISGIDRFVQKIWRFFGDVTFAKATTETETYELHRTIKRVTESIEALQFNTAISALMELLNFLQKQSTCSKETAVQFVYMLAPLAPHLAEELWTKLGNKESVFEEAWPEFDPKLVVADTVTVAIQVNGKLRGTISIASSTSKEDTIAAAKQDENVAKYLEGKKIVKEIVIPGKLVNFVVT